MPASPPKTEGPINLIFPITYLEQSLRPDHLRAAKGLAQAQPVPIPVLPMRRLAVNTCSFLFVLTLRMRG